ncbi:hypothetical protein OC861_006884 [Tilletia horrida]|nr:hypothetical protein OC861_006884 [Tilletia horrida]
MEPPNPPSASAQPKEPVLIDSVTSLQPPNPPSASAQPKEPVLIDSVEWEGRHFEVWTDSYNGVCGKGFVSDQIVEWVIARELAGYSWLRTEASDSDWTLAPYPRATLLITHFPTLLESAPEKADGPGRKPFNPFLYDFIFVPCHHGKHWTMTAIVKPWRLIHSLAPNKGPTSIPDFFLGSAQDVGRAHKRRG